MIYDEEVAFRRNGTDVSTFVPLVSVLVVAVRLSVRPNPRELPVSYQSVVSTSCCCRQQQRQVYSNVGIPRSPLFYGKLSISVVIMYISNPGSQSEPDPRQVAKACSRSNCTNNTKVDWLDSLETDARLAGNNQ